MGSITGSKWPETKNFLLKLISLLVLRNEGEKLPRNWISHTTLCTTPFTEQRKLPLTRIERVGGPGAQLSKRTSTLVSSLRNRRLTGPQLATSLNSTCKTPVSTSSVKRRLLDAGLVGRVPLSSVCVLLPILIFSFYWPVWDVSFSLQLPRRPASRSRLFTVDIETGVLWVLFNEAVSWGLVRRLFLKLDTLMYLFSYSVVHRGLPLLFLFWLETVFAVLWRK